MSLPPSLRSSCVICCIDEGHTSLNYYWISSMISLQAVLLTDPLFTHVSVFLTPNHSGWYKSESVFGCFRLDLACSSWYTLFLMAWWLGWRPSTDSSEKFKISQSDSMRACWHCSLVQLSEYQSIGGFHDE